MTEEQSDAILSALTRIADALNRIEGRLAREDEKPAAQSYDYRAANLGPYLRIPTPRCAVPPIPMDKAAVKFDADDTR